MLQEISIKDFAIIDNLNLKFYSGMTVLSGETGAGKSIIIDAVGLLAGGRGSAHFIRKGASKSVLQGMFSVPENGQTARVLEENGIDYEDNSIILQRELYANGRNVCRINGMLVNTTTLKAVGETLVDIYGQNEHQALMQPEKHIELLDEFAGPAVKDTLEQYRKVYATYNDLKTKLNNKNKSQKEWEQRLDMLNYQVKEIEEAELSDGEEEELTSERDSLNNFQNISSGLAKSLAGINGDEEGLSPIDMIGDAMSSIEDVESLDGNYKEVAENIKSAYYMLQDAASDLDNDIDGLEFDQNRLNEVEQRLSTIFELKKKYGDSIKEILDYYNKISAELSDMQGEEKGDNLQERLDDSSKKLNELGKKLSDNRHKAAEKLDKDIHKQLTELYMEKTQFEVRFTPLAPGTFNKNGIENVEFYIQTNPGEDMQPLAKIASGGELSRIMLALKTIFSKLQGVTSIIFDEVDTGVSGRVAQAIANKISLIGQKSQALCITHLPQVAAMANHQYFISKHVDNEGRTETTVEPLSGEQRVKELARMLAGTKVTDLTMEHAAELLRLADEEKAKEKK